MRETPTGASELLWAAKHALDDLCGHSLTYVNDTSDHAEILEVFNLAIAAQPEQE